MQKNSFHFRVKKCLAHVSVQPVEVQMEHTAPNSQANQHATSYTDKEKKRKETSYFYAIAKQLSLYWSE